MDLLNNVFSGLVVAVIIFLLTRIWKKAHKKIAARKPAVQQPEELNDLSRHPLYPEFSVDIPAGMSIPEKIKYLECECSKLAGEIRQVRSRDGDFEQLRQKHDELYACLCSMSFLAAEDILDGQFVLQNRVGSGRFSVVWKAYDKHKDQHVAVKFIRYPYIRDESIVQRLKTATRLMAQCHTRRIAAVRKELSIVSDGEDRQLVYYVLEFVSGVSLGDYCRSNQQGNEQVIDGLLELGRCIEQAHDDGILHRDIKIENILVRSDGKIKLVDFDAVVELNNNPVYPGNNSGGSEYSAPEVLFENEQPDVRADVFSLGRVFTHVYYGKGFPNVYELNVLDVIDAINASPDVKETLKKATSVYRSNRYESMKQFLDDMQAAVDKSREAPPLLATVRQEKSKIRKVLYHSFLGTLALMLIARPIFTLFDMAQLSDRGAVALFQGVIGSLAWGCGIAAAFILYMIVFRRDEKKGYLASMAFCGAGGVLAGLVCAVLSVLVTNVTDLTKLGWLLETFEENKPVDGVGIKDRLYITIVQTKMFFAFPLTGLLTGCGVGLCLNYGLLSLLGKNRLGTGILPVPTKFPGPWVQGFSPTVSRLLLSWKTHFFLSFPVLFGYLITFVLNPTDITEYEEIKLCIGEGLVHYFGSIGLVAGFFYKVRAQ